MSNEQDLTPQERELEQILAKASPAATGLRLELIETEAHRRQMVRQVWTWRAIAAVLVVGLGVSLVVRPQPRVVERLVEAPVEVPREVIVEVPVDGHPQVSPLPPTFTPFLRSAAARPVNSPDNYIVLRERVMERGLDALPDRPPPGSADPTPRPLDLLSVTNGGDV
jgi:hypothetical protein